MTRRRPQIVFGNMLMLLLSASGCLGAKRSIGEQPATDGTGDESGGTATGAEETSTQPPSIDCPAERVWEGEFRASQDIEDLAGYTEVTGSVQIEGVSESDLWNLQCLRTVGGRLWIGPSHEVVNLDMLESLEYVGEELSIDSHDSLENVDGLANLTHATRLSLDLNPKLADISGLAGIATSIEDISINRSGVVSLAPLAGIGSTHPIGLLQLQENPGLVDLSGLSQVTTIGALNLHYNDSLESLAGLEALEHCDADFEIGPHPRLKDLDPIDPRIDGSLQHIGNGFFRDNAILPQCAVDYLVEGIEVADMTSSSGQLDCPCDGPRCA